MRARAPHRGASRSPTRPRARLRGALVIAAAASSALVTAAPYAVAAQGRTAVPAQRVLDSSATAQPRRRSWTSDGTQYALGDIVTVLVVNRTSATANSRDIAAESRDKKLGADVRPPAGEAGPSVPMTAKVSFDQDGNSRRTGEMLRGADFRTTVSARVTAISPTGMLRIEGRSMLNVDRNVQEVSVTGWVRPQDITPGANTVESSRIADASINYTRKGSLGKPSAGIVSRILGWVWP
ncbi:MAG: flagellar basal body L-ring protein FlgH [Gemmatimonadaceae bacterium]|nr:flagellar basal body L-ring protein FlgH [Gemmatimonadaceae bacterium]